MVDVLFQGLDCSLLVASLPYFLLQGLVEVRL
jgi:hypothetical protein